jgi:hypothetical protein
MRIQNAKGLSGLIWNSLSVVFATGLIVKLRCITGDLNAWQRDSSFAQDFLA